MTEPITFRSIGIIRTPFKDVEGMPIQSTAAVGVRGRIELDPSVVEGLRDLDAFSHLTLIYHLHLAAPPRLTVTPFLDDRPHGIFATRAPARPNAIGLSTVRLVGIVGSTIEIEDVDMVDGTPLLDIKPYVPAFDARDDVEVGWYTARLTGLAQAKADDRFRPG
jgi:tRNA-Thr(GGU) m(6)t(6)A37 methyltransferase TsaA